MSSAKYETLSPTGGLAALLKTFAGVAIVRAGHVTHADGDLVSVESSQLTAFEAAFSQRSSNPRQFKVGGLSFVLVNASQGRLMAVAKGRAAGVIAVNLTERLGGVLVATWVKPLDAAAATRALDDFVSRLHT